MSRARSARGASAGAGGRGAATQRGVYVQSPRPDIYVALLGVALGAMILGCLLLILVWNRYEFSTRVSQAFGNPPAATLALAGPTGDLGKIGTVRL